jgi:hypothetical protein
MQAIAALSATGHEWQRAHAAPTNTEGIAELNHKGSVQCRMAQPIAPGIVSAAFDVSYGPSLPATDGPQGSGFADWRHPSTSGLVAARTHSSFSSRKAIANRLNSAGFSTFNPFRSIGCITDGVHFLCAASSPRARPRHHSVFCQNCSTICSGWAKG